MHLFSLVCLMFCLGNLKKKKRKKREGNRCEKEQQQKDKRDRDVRLLLILPAAVCGFGTLGCQIWVRPPSPVRHHVRFSRECSLTPIQAGRRWIENISFRRCGVVDKTLPGKTAEWRFISSTVGPKHSQASWFALTDTDAKELPLKPCHSCLPASIFY